MSLGRQSGKAVNGGPNEEEKNSKPKQQPNRKIVYRLTLFGGMSTRRIHCTRGCNSLCCMRSVWKPLCILI